MDTPSSSSPLQGCPNCDALVERSAEKCWLCGQRLGTAAGATPKPSATPPLNPYASPAPLSSADLNRTFSLSTMFLWTTLVAVVMGVSTIAPGLAVVVAILSFPAALRTIGAVARRKRRRGESMNVGEKIETFLASLGIVTAIVVGAGIAFTAVCFPLGLASFSANQGSLIIFAIVAGIAAAITVAIFLIRALWPQRN